MKKYFGLGLVSLCLFSGVLRAEVAISVTGIAEGKIAQIHACSKHGGKDLSPEIVVTGIPSDAKFVTVIVDDPDAQPVAGKTWVHWNVFNVPVTGSSMTFEEGSKPKGKVGKNSAGSSKYQGMCPPNGKHTYRFAVFTQSGEVKVKSGFSATAVTIEDFEKKNKGSILSKAVFTGDFG
jgi:Raf kinase inhibitor-like YbhB/YbcL family protein